MAELDALLTELSIDLDDEQMQALKEAVMGREKEANAKLRMQEIRLAVATDEDLAKKAPRAIKALREGAAELPEGLEDFDAWITGYEAQLEKLGVPLPSSETPPAGEEGQPTQNWGAPMSGGGTPAPDQNVDFLREAMEAGDVEKIVVTLHDMNRLGQKDKIREVTSAFQDIRPIISTT